MLLKVKQAKKKKPLFDFCISSGFMWESGRLEDGLHMAMKKSCHSRFLSVFIFC